LIAFTIGALVQYLTRLIFTFNYRKRMKYLGSVFGGISITAITYFILIKGIDGSVFAEIEITEGQKLGAWITENSFKVILYSFIAIVALLQLMKWIFNIKILKMTVLIGTFALAMAFAGNDLVNFIGVPIAGFSSFKSWVSAGGISPDSYGMASLQG